MPRAKARKDEPVEAGSDIVMEEAPTSHQPESRDDMSVDQDEDDEAGDVEEDEIEEEEDVQRVRLVCWVVSPSAARSAPQSRDAETDTIVASSLAQHLLPLLSSFSTRATLWGMP